MTKKRSGWFPATEKPKHIGVYEVDVPDSHDVWSSFWDGKQWMWRTPRGHDVAFQERGRKSYGVPRRWRGLAEKPE